MAKPKTKEQRYLHLADREIPFVLQRSSKRNSMVIEIDEYAHMKVFAPVYIKDDVILKFLEDKTNWIKVKIAEANKKSALLKKRRFVQGEKFFFLGKKYPLDIVARKSHHPAVEFNGQKWIVHVFEKLDEEQRQVVIKKEMVRWYTRQAKEILGSRIFTYARVMNLEPLHISIRNQKSIWGSCHPIKKSIHLNWKIIMSPVTSIDYVIVHELTHLKVPNHSARFWKELKKVYPEYKLFQNWFHDHSLDTELPSIPRVR